MGGGILMSDTLDLQLASLLLAFILIFTLIFEKFTFSLEHFFAEQEHFLEMIAKVYRELMILGFISLWLVLSLEFGAWYFQDHNILLHFEFAHLFIFFWAMVYVVIALVSVARLSATRQQWDRVSNMDTQALCARVERRLISKQKENEEEGEGEEEGDQGEASTEGMRPDQVADVIEQQLEAGKSSSWFPFWISMFPGMGNGFEDLEWKMMQRIFLRNFKLPHEFDYTKYLRQKLMDALSGSLEIRPRTWAYIILIILVYSAVLYVADNLYYDLEEDGAGSAGGGRRQLGGGGGGMAGQKLTVEVAFIQIGAMIGFGWVLVALNALIVFNIKSGIHTLLAHQGCKRPNSASLFLRKLDAQLQARLAIPKHPIFADGGEDFAAAASAALDVRFFSPGARLATEGDEGDSMFFIIDGTVNIVHEADGNVLTSLGPGNVLGETCLLLGGKRSKSIVASTVCTVCILDKASFKPLAEEFGHMVENMMALAQARKAMHSSADASNVMLKKVAPVVVQEEEEDAAEGGEEGHEGHGEGHGHGDHHSHKLPGMGKGHGHGEGENAGDNKMKWADEILPDSKKERLDNVGEILMMLNCFYVTFYLLRMLLVVIPTADLPIYVTIWAHVLIIAPSVVIVIFLAPMHAKYKCLLANVLERDDELIAAVSSARAKVINLRNEMRDKLMHHGIKLAHEQGIDEEQITAIDVSRYAFEMIDDDGSGELSYAELKRGLPQFGIFLSKEEFSSVCRLIDPDQDGSLVMDEWLNFMQSTDDDLMGDDWQQGTSSVKLRNKVKQALLDPAMAMFWEHAKPGTPEPTIQDILKHIVKELDTDGGGSLDFLELKVGMEQHDVVISQDEFNKLGSLVDVGGTGEFTAEMLCAFMEMTDSELEIIDEKERREEKERADEIARQKAEKRGEDLPDEIKNPMLDDDSSPSPRSRAGKLKDKAVALEHEVVKDALKLEHEVVKDAKAGAKAVAKGAVRAEKELVKDVKAVEKELVKDGKAVATALAAGPLPSEEQAAKDEDEREAARLKQRDALQKKAEKQRAREEKEAAKRAKKKGDSPK